MPVDQYFVTGDYKDFMSWMEETRLQLLALNKFRPDNQGAIANADSIKHFLETRIQSEAVKLYSEQTKKEQDAYIAAITANSNLLRNDGLEEKKKKINDEIKNRSKQDENNPIPENERIKGDAGHQVGFSNSYTHADENGNVIVSTAAFPVLGKPYDNLKEQITGQMIRNDTFEVFSGYKKDPNVEPEVLFKSWVIQKGATASTREPDPSRTFTIDRPYSAYANDILDKIEAQNFPGSYKFFIEKLHGRYSDGQPYKMNKIKSQKKVLGEQNLSNRMVFSAYIDNYNDDYNIDQGSYSFLGRGEGVPIYKSTKRGITLEFTILSDYSAEYMSAMELFDRQLGKVENERSGELLRKLIKEAGPDWGLGDIKPPKIYEDGRVGGHVPGMYSDTPEGLWSKLTFLAQCCYPYYRQDGKMKEQPMIRMRIADFYDVVASISSMNIQMNTFDGPMIDMNPSSLGNIPFGVKVTMQGTIIHNHEPSSDYYGFYHRLEYDNGTKDPVTGLGINLHENKMQQGATKNSPIDFMNSFVNDKDLGINDIDIKSLQTLNSSLNDFKNNFGILSNPGVNLKTSYIKEKTKKSIEAFDAVSKIVNYFRIRQGIDNIDEKKAPKKGLSTLTDSERTAKEIKKDTEMSVGSVLKTVNEATQAISNTNDDLKRIGINLIKDEEINSAVQQIKSLAPKNIIPKTLGDILNKVSESNKGIGGVIR